MKRCSRRCGFGLAEVGLVAWLIASLLVLGCNGEEDPPAEDTIDTTETADDSAEDTTEETVDDTTADTDTEEPIEFSCFDEGWSTTMGSEGGEVSPRATWVI